ncbi:ABC transporter permease [Cumulibacter soli]|uniref:ABC transporter permease n=1 Tax=Cumulibacter soli TaxID=2546344 RepID=UPI00141A1382|nr:ABC transporter permease [Cumulibacter soli]
MSTEPTVNVAAPNSGAKKHSERFRTIHRFVRQRLAFASLCVLVVMVLLALLAPVIAPYPPAQNSLQDALQGPSGAHWLGTDDLGRDMFSRVLYGMRTSLLAAAQATALSVVLGAPLGIIAGYLGGKWDAVLSRIADALMTFPGLLLAVVIVGIRGPGLTNAMLAIGIVYAPRLFRVARASAASIKPETYIRAAETLGCSKTRIVMRHLVPNALSPIVVQISLAMGTALLVEASLSFLGLGVQPPDASLGSLLGRAVPYVSQIPVAVIVSGSLIAIAVLAFNLVGDGIRDSIGRERRS